ncbi:MAG TPA: hypothetical protein PLF22_11375 [Pseudomonadales bacterium]|nr:hypothetical protein [Pseudomonadales bacterium]
MPGLHFQTSQQDGTTGFFNLVLELELNEQEKKDLVEFMRVL